jgi:hypothetical protein
MWAIRIAKRAADVTAQRIMRGKQRHSKRRLKGKQIPFLALVGP